MLIGVNSLIGYTVIPGPLTAPGSITQNALKTFRNVGGLPATATPRDAAQFARNFAVQLQQMKAVPDPIVRGFPHIHSQLCAEAAVVPIALYSAFESFQKEPTVAGAATYFDILATALSEDAPRQKPKTPSK